MEEQNKGAAAGTLEPDTNAAENPGGAQEYTYKPDQHTTEDYTSEDQAQEIYDAQSGMAVSYLWRFCVSLVVTAALLYLDFARPFGFPLPEVLDSGRDPLVFLTANMVLLAAGGALCLSAAVGGILGIFRLKADSDSFTSLAFYGALIGGAALLTKPALTQNKTLYFSAAAAGVCISLNLLGKLLLTLRARGNFQLLTEHRSFRAAERVEPEGESEPLIRGLNLGDAVICSPRKALFLTRYLENAYAPSLFDRAARWLSPLLLLGAAGIAAFDYQTSRSLVEAAAVFSTACCLAVPVMGELSASLPLFRVCRGLRSKNALLTGPGTVRRFSDMTAFVVDIKSVFPEGTVSLESVKPFTKKRIDSALIDAASLACAAGGPLNDVFLSMLGTTKYLRPVEGLEAIDDRGLCGWVNNQRVLLGNRELMRKYQIEVPSHDYEAKVAANGDNPVYLAVAGELIAMLVVHYEAGREIARALRRLQKLGVTLLVATSDPNITCAMLAERFSLDVRGVKVLGTEERTLLQKAPADGKAEAGLAFTDEGGAASYAGAAAACIKLQGTFAVTTVIQAAGALVGLAFMLYAALAGVAVQVTPVQVVAFQCIWALPVLLITLLRKH